ncbi:SixA phosphatase family protein [Aestuariicoccus sp. MJ-SS9]|uniref:SixA phosphatase family protein n=1 Tax=Aestuariicoccus sp. MJ-SS9 TaxID=3079855 RepID=UPI00290F1519|nr:histidine phosphatase family protein [Aestuariicoccus sp. MJ-SS9]MDU8912230.1 histidine phosphatase family protein [Aestuariicoccus sp. MJ-SS9]
MKHLILMRHAKSDWSMNLDDHARGLNKRGERSARALGDWLRAQEYLPDQVLCSDAHRTRQTLELLALEAETDFDPRLYLSAPETMLEVLRGATGDRVLMIAHNPGICALAEHLVDEAPAHDRFADYPTGATLVAEFDIDDWKKLRPGTGRALAFVVPRELT